MRKIGKRIFSFLLCMTMLVGLIVIEPKAADETPVAVNLSTNGVKPGGQYWDFRLTTDADLPDAVHWTSYGELEAYVNGAKITAGFNKDNSSGNKRRIAVFITSDNLTLTPEFGTILTIKGTISTGENSTPINVNEFHMAWNGTMFIQVPSAQGTALSVKSLKEAKTTNTASQTDTRFTLEMSETLSGEFERIEGFTASLNGEAVTIAAFRTAGYLMVQRWGYVEPKDGDTFVLNKGIGVIGDSFIMIPRDYTLVYDAETENWFLKYTDVSLSYASANKNTQRNFWEIFLKATSEGPGTDWQTKYNELEVQVNGTKVSTQLTKADNQKIGLIVYGDKCSLTPEFGTTITIKAGESQVGEQYLRLIEDCVLEWDGSQWGDYVEGSTHAVVSKHSDSTGEDIRFYLNVSGKMPGENWESIQGLTGKLNGNQAEIYVFKDRGFLFVQLIYTNPKAGDIFTLNKGIGKKDSGNIKIPEDFTLVYTGANWEEAVITKTYKSEQFADYNKETAPTLSGFVFAGWFTDESCTIPFTDETATGDVYAKFVHEQVLSVQAQISTEHQDGSRDIRFVTTVDSLDYSEVGFEIAFGDSKTYAKRDSKTVYSSLYAMGCDSEVMSFVPSEVFSPVSEFFNTYAFKNVGSTHFDTDFKVKPYWVTLDGTKVYGTEVTKSISDGIAQE